MDDDLVDVEFDPSRKVYESKTAYHLDAEGELRIILPISATTLRTKGKQESLVVTGVRIPLWLAKLRLKGMIPMNTVELARVALECRQAQQRCSDTRSYATKAEQTRLEQKLDRCLAMVLEDDNDS